MRVKLDMATVRHGKGPVGDMPRGVRRLVRGRSQLRRHRSLFSFALVVVAAGTSTAAGLCTGSEAIVDAWDGRAWRVGSLAADEAFQVTNSREQFAVAWILAGALASRLEIVVMIAQEHALRGRNAATNAGLTAASRVFGAETADFPPTARLTADGHPPFGGRHCRSTLYRGVERLKQGLLVGWRKASIQM